MTKTKGKAVQRGSTGLWSQKYGGKARGLGAEPGLYSWFKVSLLGPLCDLGYVRPHLRDR